MELLVAPILCCPCWCKSCVSGLPRLETTWTFWDAYESWTWCSYKVETYLETLEYSSLFFRCVDEDSRIVEWNEVFLSVGEVLGWSVLVMNFHWNVCFWVLKLIWSPMDWFWKFLVGICLSSSSWYLQGPKFERIAQLYFSFEKMKSSQ